MWEMIVWAAEAESRALSMPSGRQRKQFHTRAAKTPLFQALEEIFHDSLFPCCSSVLTNILWVASYFVASDILLSTWQKYIKAKIRGKGLHIKAIANFSQLGNIWILVSTTPVGDVISPIKISFFQQMVTRTIYSWFVFRGTSQS